jgi:hypothetical protein
VPDGVRTVHQELAREHAVLAAGGLECVLDGF